ncbi:MAG: metallophosphoesterase [Proteobacteria bacterium]|nr:metallophosphoesterase [Pseudomonadota bacterium]
MKLYAISDLHLHYQVNRDALRALPPHVDDWLILAGDIGETPEHLQFAFEVLRSRWSKLIWVPGNHELWSRGADAPRGGDRYGRLVELCRDYGVLTPEDPYPAWPGPGHPIIAPLFLLYDYSFCPDGHTPQMAVEWAAKARISAVDERLLHPDPYPDRSSWCRARVAETSLRLSEIPDERHTILVNHFPLRRDLVRLLLIPRFSPWCGTTMTEDWHLRFRADVVVTGHLHVRATDYRDGVRFEEVSLGYPRQWDQRRDLESYLRLILGH